MPAYSDEQAMRRVNPYGLLILARLEGVTVSASADGERICISGDPHVIERWQPYLMARKAEVLQELLYGICGRCGERGRRLTPTYWTQWQEGFCQECINAVTAGFERDGWPAVQWDGELAVGG